MPKTLPNHKPTIKDTLEPAHPLREELAAQHALFEAQPQATQHFLDAQARALAEAITQEASQARFSLPERVTLPATGAEAAVPAAYREQMAGGLINSLTRTDLRTPHTASGCKNHGEAFAISAK